MTDWISRDDALVLLGVRAQTLYAYASRGRVGSRADPADPRRSLYRRADLEQLARRKARGRKSALIAEDAIAWGEPVLASAITTIADGRLFYRGRDAARLSETASLESVARLLRGGDGASLKGPRPGPETPEAPAVARLFDTLARRAARDQPARGRAPIALAAEASQLLDACVDAVAGAALPGRAHQRLAAAWGASAEAAERIRQALVLMADHELNASTFAARVTASTGASLSASALAGLCALSGPLHGGMAVRLDAFLDHARAVGADVAVGERVARGAPPPGFGHHLYPDGDPRARALLARVALSQTHAETLASARRLSGLEPNVDFALSALVQAYALPKDAALLIFATARTAGWLAHAIEQVRTGRLIRPRARYIGPEPVG